MSSVKVLDKGHVRLVGHHGDDLLVVNAARVSFAKESKWESDGDHAPQVLSTKDAKLIQYLARGCSAGEFDELVDSLADSADKQTIRDALWRFRDTPMHHTPFGHPQITLHFRWPIFVARQAMRSNIGICWNEESRRYIDSPPEFYEPEVWRGRPEGSIKQGSGGPVDEQQWCDETYRQITKTCDMFYRHIVKQGVAPEMARMVLPQSTYTECWGTFSLAALARFYKLRSDSHAQKEIQDYAEAIDSLVRPLFPVSWAALTGTQD